MNKKILFAIVLGIVIIVIVVISTNKPHNEGLVLSPQVDRTLQVAEELHYKPGFLPSHQGPWFQNLPPSLRVENNYHSCIQAEGGDYGNYELRQKCYVKTLKDGTYDKADLMCWNHRNNEENYFRCLDFIYSGGNSWMDRGSSSFCLCPDGITPGAGKADGSCFCPSQRPMNDRREVDENDQIIDRI